MTPEKILLALLLIGSGLAFFLYGIDKYKARRGAWRISERTLLLTGLLVGGVGALLSMQLFRHKTRHTYFYAVNIAGALWQLGLLAYLFLIR